MLSQSLPSAITCLLRLYAPNAGTLSLSPEKGHCYYRHAFVLANFIPLQVTSHWFYPCCWFTFIPHTQNVLYFYKFSCDLLTYFHFVHLLIFLTLLVDYPSMIWRRNRCNRIILSEWNSKLHSYLYITADCMESVISYTPFFLCI